MRKETCKLGLVSIGIVIIAFLTKEQANKAIKNRLYIASISTKVVKYTIYTPSTIQCNKCVGFGHFKLLCKREPRYMLYANNHRASQHSCSICNKIGQKCQHLSLKYANYNSITHSANSKLCDG